LIKISEKEVNWGIAGFICEENNSWTEIRFKKLKRRSLNDKCGIEIVNYVDAATKYETLEKYAEREKIMDFLSGEYYW